MPITTTEYANFEKKAFFDNREWLNQENWQMYFGGSLPSGVLVKGRLEADGVNYTSALSRQVINQNYIQFRAGAILANGIYASYNGGTSIPTIKSAEIDRLFVARVFNTAGNIKIVGMTKVAAEYGYTPTVFAKMLLQDESLAMTRNESYYDIPLCYEVFGNDVYDLRRLIYLPGQAPDVEITYSHDDVTNTETIPDILYGRDFIQVYGGMNYNVNFATGDTADTFYIYLNPSCSEKQTVVKLANYSSVAKQIRIPLQWKGLQFSYSWLESWDTDPNSQYLYKELVAGDKVTMIFIPNGHTTTFDYTVTNKSAASGGGLDPDDYFTKQEISAMFVLKANVSDMDEALALKENISNLGALAYINQADYVTQVANKPTLGAMASKDSVSLTNDVSGVLPVYNGGTGGRGIDDLINSAFGEHEYYVSASNGNDYASGTSSNPFKTIQKAINSGGYCAKTTIHIKAGAYAEDIVIPYGKNIIFICDDSATTRTISPASLYNHTITVLGHLNIKEGSYSISANSGKNSVYVADGGVFIFDTGSVNFNQSLMVARGGIANIEGGSVSGNLAAYGGIITARLSAVEYNTKTAKYGGIIQATN